MGQIADHVPEPREPRYPSLDSHFDVFAFLEAANWFHSEHLSSLLNGTRRTNAAVVISDRVTVGLARDNLPNEDVDFNRSAALMSCVMISTKAAWQIPIWGMTGRQLAPARDRLIYILPDLLGFERAWSSRSTMFHESNGHHHYVAVGVAPPEHENFVDTPTVEAEF